MTSQISKIRVLVIAFFMMASVNIQAQQSDMQALIGQSLSKLEQPTPEAFLNCIAEMKRIDVMFPDSIQPKYQMVCSVSASMVSVWGAWGFMTA